MKQIANDKKSQITEEIMDQYRIGVVETSLTPVKFGNRRKSLISRKNFEMTEITAQIISKEEKPTNENIFGLTKPDDSKEKVISIETKTIILKNPFVNIKSFRIEEFISFFNNLYREENIIGQNHFSLIIKLINETLPNVIISI